MLSAVIVAAVEGTTSDGSFETDIIAHLKRIYWFTRRTARVAVPVHERSDA